MSKIEEIERLKELKKQAKELDHKIIQYSIYPNKEIAYTLKELLIESETIPFHVVKTTMIYGYLLYSPGISNSGIFLKNNIEDFHAWEFEDIPVDHIVLCPTEYEKTTDYYKKTSITKHISQFIDFAFQKRIEKNLTNITAQDLKNILEEYIKIRNQENKEIILTKEQKQREIFEKNCLIDRESFFDAIADVITNSEEKASSRTHYDKQLDKNSKEDTFLLSHSVYILVNGRLRDFKVLLDKVKIPKEKENEIQIDPTKKPYVNFFDIKNYFSYAYENLDCFKQFMDEVEALYEEKRVLEKEDINYVVENMNKNTNKIMKKQAVTNA